MSGLLKVTAIGNVGSAPEMRSTAAGRQVTSFRMACNRTSTAADGQRTESVEWLSVSCWGKLADICSQYLHKGSRVYVEGRLATRTYDAANGEKRFSLDVTASELHLIGGKRDGEQPATVGSPASAGAPEDLDSIPF